MWLNEPWRRWMRQAPRQLRRRCRHSCTQKRLTVEVLEDRTLLSGGGVSSTTGLIAAIQAANTAGGATTITLAAGTVLPLPGGNGPVIPTYIPVDFNFTSPNNYTNGANALPVITGNITIVGNGDIIERTTGSTPFRLFDVASRGSLTLQNLTLQGGWAQGSGTAGVVPGPATASEGGAIYSSGTLNLGGVTVNSNLARGSSGASGLVGSSGTNGGNAAGGGLYVAGGSFSMTNSTLSSNTVRGGNAGTGGNGGTIHSKGPGGPGGGGGVGGSASGGGLYVAAGSVKLSNDTVYDNQAFGGKGGYGGNGYGQNPGGAGGVGGAAAGGGVNATNLTLVNDSFVDNATYGGLGGNGGNGFQQDDTGDGGNGGSAAGGGVLAISVTAIDDTFSANGAFGGLGGLGGINYKGGGGSAGQGGRGGDGQGGGLYASSPTLVNVTLNGNAAQGGFGGDGGVGAPGRSSIFGGTPGGNGGLGGPGGSGEGGGLFVLGGTFLINDTISGNNANSGDGGNGGNAEGGGTAGAGGEGGGGGGGGVWSLQPTPESVTQAENTIFAENSAAESLGGSGGGGNTHGAQGASGDANGPDFFGTVYNSDCNLIGNNSGSTGFGSSGDLVNMAPDLGPLQYNGGPTETMAELPDSLTIGAGDPTVPGLALTKGTDQRGHDRFGINAAGKETVDIGAYEYPAVSGTTTATQALSISGSGSSSTTSSGQITYTFTVNNNGSTAQSDVDVVDQLPANTTLVSWTAAAGWASSAPPAGSSSGTVSAIVASLPANSSATFTLVVQVAPGTPVGTVINDTASFGPFDETSNSGTNSASINTPFQYAPTVSVTDAGGIYNGIAFPATATVTGVSGIPGNSLEGVNLTLDYKRLDGNGNVTADLGPNAPVDAGTYEVIASFAGSTDYTSAQSSTTFAINVGAGYVYVLNSSASGALTLSGNATISSAGEVVVDSSSNSAVRASGNAQVTATGGLWVEGGVSISGGASLVDKGTPAAIGDPLADLAAPSISGSSSSVNLTSGSLTISQGIYSSIKVSGNASLTLNPGIYIIAGGGFTVTGNASVTGHGVTIYNTGSNYGTSGTNGKYGGITLSGNGTVNLTAPTSGDYAGVVIFQDRLNTRAISMSGNAMGGISGIIYAPNALLFLSGKAGVNGTIVVNELTLSGNGASAQAVDGSDITGGVAAGQLLAGDVVVYVDNSSGLFTADELARIQDAVSSVDATVEPYGVSVSETTDPTAANVVVATGTTSAVGGYSDGILGCYTTAGEITLIQGWNWYAGADPTQIGANHYDFQTTVTHELGHALGLGESSTTTSAMYGTLAPGTTIRTLTTADLNIPYDEGSADAQRAALPPLHSVTSVMNGSSTATFQGVAAPSGTSTLGSSNPLSFEDQVFTNLALLLSEARNAYQSELSSVAAIWQSADALILQRLDALLSLEAGAMGVTKDILIPELVFATMSSLNGV